METGLGDTRNIYKVLMLRYTVYIHQCVLFKGAGLLQTSSQSVCLIKGWIVVSPSRFSKLTLAAADIVLFIYSHIMRNEKHSW